VPRGSISISTISLWPSANGIESSKYLGEGGKMLIYSIQRQWVPNVIVFYCSREVADGFRYDTPYIRAGGSTEGESKAHQCKLITIFTAVLL